MPHICRICHATSTECYTAQEVKQGTNDLFTYFKCPQCGCLQIAETPTNLAHYYHNYYSTAQRSSHENGIVSWLRKQIFGIYTHTSTPIRLLGKALSYLSNSYYWMLEGGGKINFDSRILDVGCGSGRLLIKLGNSGFKHLHGIDPFIDLPITHHCRYTTVHIDKGEVASLNEKYDFIMLHHVLEHIDNQQELFATLASLLNPTGQILINLPVVDTPIWEQYKQNCFQLEDAPRHLYLHTYESIQRLAQGSNLRIEHITHLASKDMFVASERLAYRKQGITPRRIGILKSLYFHLKAKRLAQQDKSGIVCFYLTHKV